MPRPAGDAQICERWGNGHPRVHPACQGCLRHSNHPETQEDIKNPQESGRRTTTRILGGNPIVRLPV
ncbi:hypothetical protein DC28_05930 [Spirochaeta lutea]|uniref:Uncharacterized protein n=1 Tax=Spirochaeta lutea TaxID=1480694 RepID=A0A098QZ31_9SPIO|nr:hypothetical protein DC28_05930 [Spirochaeta lutea]